MAARRCKGPSPNKALLDGKWMACCVARFAGEGGESGIGTAMLSSDAAATPSSDSKGVDCGSIPSVGFRR